MSARSGKSREAEAPSLAKRMRLRLGVSWRAVLGLVLGSALGLALLWVAARGVKLSQVWSRLARADPLWVALAFLAVVLTTAAKTARWRGLFPEAQRARYSRLGRVLLVGKLANALLPARMGDVIRVYMVGEEEGISKAMVLGTVAAEKAFDVLFLLLFGGLAAALVPLPPWLNIPLAGLTVSGFLFVLLALAWPEQGIMAWVGRWVHRLPWGMGRRMTEALRKGLLGLAALREPRMALTACAWSAVVWILAAGTNCLLFQAFDLRLSVGAGLLLLVLLHAGVAPPSSPGRLGVFHSLTVLGLEVFGVDRALSLAYATVLHATVYLPEILPGAIVLGLDLAAGRRVDKA